MKTDVSIPDELFHQAEEHATRLGYSRSELYTRAIQHYLDQHSEEAVLEQLNAIYAEDATTEPEPLLDRLQRDFLLVGKW